MNYSITDKECLAVVWASCKLCPYIYGHLFNIITGHHVLCWVVNMNNPTGRLERWVLKLLEYDLTIRCRSGKTHVDADCLP